MLLPPSTDLPIHEVSQTGGDIVPNENQSELQMYNRRKFHHNSNDISASLEQNQSPSPTGSVEPSLPGNSNSFVEPEKITSDLNIPIALR